MSVTRPQAAAPEHDITGLAAASLQAGLEPWQRRALLDMANSPGTPADVVQLLQRCTDEQLVLAAGFVPMLPALLQSDLPAGHPVLSGRPLFKVGNSGPSARLPHYRPGLVYEVLFGRNHAAAKAFQDSLPKQLLAVSHCYDLTRPAAGQSAEWSVAVECRATGGTATAQARGQRFYQAMLALYESGPPAPAPLPALVQQQPLMLPELPASTYTEEGHWPTYAERRGR